MNQKLSWTLLVAGGVTFLAALGHSLETHSTWASVVTPQSIGELLVQLATAATAVGGALGIVLKGSQAS